MNKKFLVVEWVSITSIAISTFVILYWLLWPHGTIVMNTHPMKVISKEMEVGDTLAYIADYCRHTSTSVHISRRLESEKEIILLPSSISQFTPGCRIVTVREISLPANIPPGEYKLVLSLQFKLNPLRTKTEVIETEGFTVLSRSQDD